MLSCCYDHWSLDHSCHLCQLLITFLLNRFSLPGSPLLPHILCVPRRKNLSLSPIPSIAFRYCFLALTSLSSQVSCPCCVHPSSQLQELLALWTGRGFLLPRPQVEPLYDRNASLSAFPPVDPSGLSSCVCVFQEAFPDIASPSHWSASKYNMMISSVDCSPRWSGFRPLLYQLHVAWHWTSHLTSLCLSSVICEVELTIVQYLSPKTVVRIDELLYVNHS